MILVTENTFTGKVIKTIDFSFLNLVRIYFTDSSIISIPKDIHKPSQYTDHEVSDTISYESVK